MISVRRVGPEDVSECTPLLIAAHYEGAAGQALRLTPKRAREKLCALLNSDRDLLVVAEAADGPVGILAGRLERADYLQETQVRLLYLYVDPAHRGRLAAGRLVHALIAWGRRRRAYAVILDMDVGSAGERLLRKRGLRPKQLRYKLPL